MEPQIKKHVVALTWETAKVFTTLSLADAAAIGAVAVKVNRAATDTGKQIFSVELGRIHPEGKFVRFLSPKVVIQNWHATVTFPDVAEFESLANLAQEYIREKIQQELYAKVDEKREREEAELSRGTKAPLPGLKKIGKQHQAK